MAKPIFLIQVPGSTPPDKTAEIQKKLSDKIPDWHILILAVSSTNKVTFSAYSEQSALDIDLEIDKLKEMILNQI